MTENEVIKALECCAYWENDKTCEDCPANTYDFSCANRMAKYALNFINRRKAEIEQEIKEIKSEAIKEFAERLKSKVNDLEFRTKTHRKTVPTKFCDDNANWVLHECVPSEIDNLVKEMTEGQE